MPSRRDILAAGATICGSFMLPRTVRAGVDARPVLVSVLTCLRPHGVSYLSGTLKCVDAEAGRASRLLVCDGEEVLWPGWTRAVIPQRARQRGVLPDNKIPGWVAIRAAVSMGADLLFLEDDIRPLRRGAIAEMIDHVVPDNLGFTSFFSRGRTAGIHRAEKFQMSQAVKLPLRSLNVLARAESTDPLQWRMIVGVDLAMSAFGRIAGWSFEQTPNLIEHIGLCSAAHPT